MINFSQILIFINICSAEVLEYAKTIGLTVPSKKYISVRIIQTKRYNNCLSVEFQSMTEPTTGTFLVRTSPEWKLLINK